MTVRHKSPWTPTLLVGLTACAGALSPVSQAKTILAPNDAERSVEHTFAAYGIPVVEHALDGRVRSGRFDPTATWGAQVADRVVCGPDTEGELHARPTELEVIATIRTSMQQGTRVELESYGHGLNDQGAKVPCRLAPATADDILAALPAPLRGG
jgi:hypothetical protein